MDAFAAWRVQSGVIRFGMTKMQRLALVVGGMCMALSGSGCKKQAATPVTPLADEAPAPASPAAPAAANADPAAETFVRALYAQYDKPQYNQVKSHPFNPLRNGDPEAWFTPEIVHLQKGNPRMTQYEATDLESDEVCGLRWCQSVEVVALKMSPTGAGKADADVTLKGIDDENPDFTLRRRLMLVQTGAGWRVDGVTEAGDPTEEMRQYFSSVYGNKARGGSAAKLAAMHLQAL